MSLAKKAYHKIKFNILASYFSPGQVLKEADLAKRLKMSRTPIREALRKLAHEGLLKNIPNKGVLVKELSLQDIMEIDQVREFLEGPAARLAADKINITKLEKIERSLKRLIQNIPGPAEFERFVEVDLEFHLLIAQTIGNGRLEAIVANLMEIISQVRKTRTAKRLRESVRELLDIISALKVKDGIRAETLIRAHIVSARKSSIEFF